jgi:hypothetical protein
MEKLNINHDADNTIQAFLGDRDLNALMERIRILVFAELGAGTIKSRIIENVIKTEARNSTEIVAITMIIVAEMRSYVDFMFSRVREE